MGAIDVFSILETYSNHNEKNRTYNKLYASW